MLMFYKIVLAALLPLALGTGSVHAQMDARTFFKDRIKLTDAEIQTMEKGQVVTKVLQSGDPTYGILIFGGVYVNGTVEKLAQVVRDVSKLQGEKVYLVVQEFSKIRAAPKLSDFARLEVEKKDIDEIQGCKAGDGDIEVMDVDGLK